MKINEGVLDCLFIGIAGVLLLPILSVQTVIAIMLLAMALKPSRK